MTTPTFTIDRRPRLWVQTTGDDKDTQNGYNGALRKSEADAVSWMVTRAGSILDATGPIPVIVHVPPGKQKADEKYTATLNGPLSGNARAAYEALCDLCRRRGSTIEPYIGWPYDPESPKSNRTRNKEGRYVCPVDCMGESALAAWFRDQYKGWASSRIWLDELEDARTPAPRMAAAIERILWTTTVGGEAFPLRDTKQPGNAPGGKRYIIDTTRAKERPWLCKYLWFKSFDPAGEFVCDPLTTEMHVVIGKEDAHTSESLVLLAASLQRRGFIADIGWDVPTDTARQIVQLQRGNQ